MTEGLVESDFCGLTKENAVTTGQKLYLNHGITGIRGQMEAGLPALKQGLATWQETVSRVRDIVAENPYPDPETLRQLDREFIQKNLSPGGSADLLAICYLFYFLETEV